jgi:thiol-disulfide isomerase/thioredoxin
MLALPLLVFAAAGLTPVDEAAYPKAVAANKGEVVLVSFWATWCEPCRKEIPQLVALEKALSAKGFTLVTISADEPEDAQRAERFLDQHRVAAPRYIRRAKSEDAFINAIDRKWSGALPALFLYNRQGVKVQSFFGETDLKKVEAEIRKLL